MTALSANHRRAPQDSMGLRGQASTGPAGELERHGGGENVEEREHQETLFQTSFLGGRGKGRKEVKDRGAEGRVGP